MSSGFQSGQGFTNSLPVFETVARSRISLSMVTLTVPFQMLLFMLKIRFNKKKETFSDLPFAAS